MTHFRPVFCTASGALASSEMRLEQGENPLPQRLNAKQRRLSRPNTKEEVRVRRLKRKELKRSQQKLFSKRQKRCKNVKYIDKKIERETCDMKKKLDEQRKYAKEQRKRAIYFWKSWRAIKNNGNVREIETANIEDFKENVTLGKGRFGTCQKKVYRGNIVCVKYFKENTTKDVVQREAMIINSLDHPGLPYAFGIVTTTQPFALVMEFYGIDGKTVTIADAARDNLLFDQKQWAVALSHCSQAISHIHKNHYLHCDLKGDNIVFNNVDGNFFPVIVDFGKMKKIDDVKRYKLTIQEQEMYRQRHKHIAPEVVRGIEAPSPASDIYAFGLVISLICYYNRSFEELRKLAVKCIHGTPHRRPRIESIMSDLDSVLHSRHNTEQM